MSVTSAKASLTPPAVGGEPWIVATGGNVTYTVPAGRTLVLASAANTSGGLALASITVNGVTANLASSWNNVANQTIPPVCFMVAPMVFKSGVTFTLNTGHFSGYLI